MDPQDDGVIDAKTLFRERRLQADADEAGFDLEVYRLIIERLAPDQGGDADDPQGG